MEVRDSSSEKRLLTFGDEKSCVACKSVFLKGQGEKERKSTSEYLWKDKTCTLYVYLKNMDFKRQGIYHKLVELESLQISLIYLF